MTEVNDCPVAVPVASSRVGRLAWWAVVSTASRVRTEGDLGGFK